MDGGIATPGGMEAVFKVDEAKIRGHVHQVVRESVEETLNALLDAEADALCQAKRYERSADRASSRRTVWASVMVVPPDGSKDG